MLDEELYGFFSGFGACCFWCLHAANSIVNLLGSGVVWGVWVVVWELYSGREHLTTTIFVPTVWLVCGCCFLQIFSSNNFFDCSCVCFVFVLAYERFCVCKFLRAHGGCLGIGSR